jgi:hypothetical protein
MKRTLLSSSLVALASVAAMALGAGAQAGISAHTCTSGPTNYQGARAYVSCGPATAVVKLGGRTLRYRGGTCNRTDKALELNIGTTIPGDTTKPLPRYFGISIGRIFGVGKAAPRDGSYGGGTLALVDGGKRYASFDAGVALTGGRTRGSFTARLLGGGALSGSFSC